MGARRTECRRHAPCATAGRTARRSVPATLLALAVLAFALRVSAVLALDAWRDPFTYEHGEIAKNLLAGRGFSVEFLGVDGATAQQAPFYPMLLAAAYRLFGIDRPAAFLAVQILQCLAGAVTAVAVVWLGWSLLPGRAGGWIAGLAVAVHPVQIYMVTHLQVVAWATLVLTVLLAASFSLRFRGTRGAVFCGLLLGILLLIEPIFAVIAPIVALHRWLVTRRSGGTPAPPKHLPPLPLGEVGRGSGRVRGARRAGFQAIASVGIMTTATCLVVAPWIWRNDRTFGEVVFIKSTFGYAFWQGNNPHSWGTDKVKKATVEQLRRSHDGTPRAVHQAAWEARHETLYVDHLALSDEDRLDLARYEEPQRCRQLGRRAWRYILDNPGRYLQLCGIRLRYFLLFDETNPKAAHILYRGATILWLALCLAGIWYSRPYWHRLWPTFAVFAAVMIFHVLTIVSARFRIPLEPMTMVWVAAVFAHPRSQAPDSSSSA